MRIKLDAKVRTKDGHGAGHVKKVIWDPKTNEVTAFIIATGGLLGHDVLIGRDVLESATFRVFKLPRTFADGSLQRLFELRTPCELDREFAPTRLRALELFAKARELALHHLRVLDGCSLSASGLAKVCLDRLRQFP